MGVNVVRGTKSYGGQSRTGDKVVRIQCRTGVNVVQGLMSYGGQCRRKTSNNSHPCVGISTLL